MSTRAVTIIKFFGAWVCIIASCVLIVLGHQLFGLPGVLAILAIAFAQAPVNW
jgi:hypothetical protein